MKKNLLAMLLALAMVLTLLAGCGSGATTASQPSSETNASVSEEENAPADDAPAAPDAAPAEEGSAAEEAPADVELREPIEYPLVDETVTLTYWQAWPPFLNEISAPEDAAMFEKLEEITGVHLNIQAVSTEESETKFMLMCSTGDMTDLIQKGAQNYTGGGAKAIEDDILVDMLPLLEEWSVNFWNLMESDVTFKNSVINDEGQVPMLIGAYKDPYYTDQGFWIRQDILDAVGKDVPTTIAELDDVLAAFKEYGLTDPLVVLSEGNCALINGAYDSGDKIVDGEMVFGATSDGTKEALKKMNEYYEKGYINVDFVTYTDSDTKPPQDVILSDNGGIFNEDVASIAGYYLMANEGFELAPLGQIRKEEGQVLNTGFIPQYAADKYSLSMSTNCEEQEIAIKYMDYLFSDEGFIMANYGIEDYTYTIDANGDYQFTDLILNNPQGFDWQLCQSLYINPGFPCLNDLAAQELTYNDAQKAAVPTWVAAYDSSDETMPNQNWLSYTTDESYTMAEIQSDIETYQEEMRLKFITGQADIDAEWDNYVATLEGMRIDEMNEITAAAVERYLSK